MVVELETATFLGILLKRNLPPKSGVFQFFGNKTRNQIISTFDLTFSFGGIKDCNYLIIK